MRGVALGVIVVMLAGAPAGAQYFGRNKVQYKKFDFQVLTTENFDIYYYPEAREGIDLAARMAERWRTRLQRLLAHELTGRQPLILYASHVDFEQTNTIQGEISEGTGGVTEPLRRRIILPLAGSLADTDHVIGHELVHAFQFDIGGSRQASSGMSGIERLPLWFIEGMAEYLSIGPTDPNTAMWLRDAARGDTLPSIKDLADPQYFPYRWGQAFWAYVGGRYGDAVVGDMLKAGAAAGDADVAINVVLGITPEQLSTEWHEAIRAAYAPVLASTMPPAEVGQVVIAGDRAGGDLNVAPAISPDGRYIAFISERSLFSIDLYVADAGTGKVRHRLTSTASSPHYSSIQFIYSAGGWDSTSRRLAAATVVGGRPAIAIFDGLSGEREREFAVADVDEVFNPTWSPDGHSIAFTAMTRGVTDLFVLDVTTGASRALTNDPFTELQPAWSPDGHAIAFATDRYTSQLGTLALGELRLARIDPVTGAASEIGGFRTGKNINPQWSADGRTLYFISDENGISNLARVGADGSDPARLTNVATGISGITSTSPALSVAQGAGVAAFSVYDRGKYDIYTRPLPAVPPLSAFRAVSSTAAVLPPPTRGPSAVAALLDDPRTGLPQTRTYESTAYKARFGIETIGQPQIGVGANRFGAFVGGGLSAYFSDVLGDRTLGTAVQLNSGVGGGFSVKDTAAQVSYLDQTRRWNWGVVGGQVPYLSGAYQEALADVDGVPSLLRQTRIFRQTEQSVAGVAAYPFNRAQRLELQAGATRLSFDEIVRTEAYALDTGQLFFDESESQRAGEPLTVGNTSAALVFDSSAFGATSPVLGQRYRVEVGRTFRGLDYTSVLADYRRYVMPASLYTIAGRVMHYGRYGAAGQDPRLYPLYLGYPTLVRGYDVNGFDTSDCTPGTDDCVTIDQLTGSRMLVGNLEFRFPLLRPFGRAAARSYGPIPVEVALFADAGVAWSAGETPQWVGGSRRGMASTGVSFRVNVLGFAIGEFAFSRPLQRRREGWVFQFNLSPGF